jgi:hypothetical protein
MSKHKGQQSIVVEQDVEQVKTPVLKQDIDVFMHIHSINIGDKTWYDPRTVINMKAGTPVLFIKKYGAVSTVKIQMINCEVTIDLPEDAIDYGN